MLISSQHVRISQQLDSIHRVLHRTIHRGECQNTIMMNSIMMNRIVKSGDACLSAERTTIFTLQPIFEALFLFRSFETMRNVETDSTNKMLETLATDKYMYYLYTYTS